MATDIGSIFAKSETLSTSDNTSSVVSMTLFVALLIACILIGHLLEKTRGLNESITKIAIGLCAGIAISLISGRKSSHLLVFSEDIFFNYLLPPIIFNAGFQVKKEQFFCNFMTIMLFGAVGTLISFAIISFGATHLFEKLKVGSLDITDFFAIGAIFSATDSVCTLQVLNQDETPLLYNLVFGEGVVNDATSIVLFNAIKKFDLNHMDPSIVWKFMGNFLYLLISSTLLGVLAGVLTNFIVKKLYSNRKRHSTDSEVALMFLMAYLSYMLAELFNLSAILTVFFCGIVMSHYTSHSVTERARVTSKHAFATLSFVAETFLFLYVGMDALDIEKWSVVSNSSSLVNSIKVSFILMGLVIIGRAALVFPLSFLSNLINGTKNEKIEIKQQVIIWWAGLMRGAVSMALTYNQFTGSAAKLRGNAFMITSTNTVVLTSTVVLGLLTKPLLRILLGASNINNTIPSESSSPKSLTLPFQNEQDSEANENNTISAEPSTPKSLTLPLLSNDQDVEV